MLYGIRAITSAAVRFTWVNADFLMKHNISAWQDMPVWVPGSGETAGFSRMSNRRALEKGLTFRPLADTASATLEDYKKRSAEAKKAMRAGLTPEREAEVLKAWHTDRKIG